MFSKKMFVQQFLLHAFDSWIHDAVAPGHHGNFFHDDHIMDRLEGVLSPSEGAMAVDQHTRNFVFIDRF